MTLKTLKIKYDFKKLGTSFILFLSLSLLFSCDATEPKRNDQLVLSLEEVSSTEVWLKLNNGASSLPMDIDIIQNSQSFETIRITEVESVLYVDSLLPNTTYNFKVTGSQQQVVSNELQVTTMDTTSHNFSLQTFTFGEDGAGSSSFYNVAIIDENNIWAVGEIYMNDSLGQPDPIAYNAVHWDGTSWEVKKISVLFRGNLITPPLAGVIAFSKEDIWFVGSLPIHGDGKNWRMYDLRTIVDPSLSLTKVWGSRSDNIYFVGRSGSIAHYNGSTWTKIESGTEANINDIWGSINVQTGQSFILCAVSNIYQLSEHRILRIDEQNNVEQITWNTDRRVSSIWLEDYFKLHVCGGGVFFSGNSKEWQEQTELPLTFTRRIRGNSKNDLFVAGDFGLIAHFNGKSWKKYDEAAVALFYSLDYKNNSMIAVGQRNGKGIILYMKKT